MTKVDRRRDMKHDNCDDRPSQDSSRHDKYDFVPVSSDTDRPTVTFLSPPPIRAAVTGSGSGSDQLSLYASLLSEPVVTAACVSANDI